MRLYLGLYLIDMIDVAHLHPLIVPREYIESGSWDLPHVALPNQAFILTWVSYGEVMVYLDRAEFDELESSGHPWQRQALENVRQTKYFQRYHQHDADGKLAWVAFVNDDDTISSSKVLLAHELSQLFPEGYHLAIPDRACGVVVSNACSDDALREVVRMIEQMHDGANTPMSPQLYPATDFQLPTKWTIPDPGADISAAIVDQFRQSGL
ncbi:hypothetical protein [Hymenobacter sp. B81]|uniref:hypothetical protein n=1 Tax=Hymenobacter sp. B81 TaxID=3344878 RepID=UPI0037DC5692